MHSTSTKSKPILIKRNKNTNKYSLSNYKNYDYSYNKICNDDVTNNKSYSEKKTLTRKYSYDSLIPNNPFGKSPPTNDSYQNIYLNILANTYLKLPLNE